MLLFFVLVVYILLLFWITLLSINQIAEPTLKCCFDRQTKEKKRLNKKIPKQIIPKVLKFLIVTWCYVLCLGFFAQYFFQFTTAIEWNPPMTGINQRVFMHAEKYEKTPVTSYITMTTFIGNIIWLICLTRTSVKAKSHQYFPKIC